ncbi:MAG: efflux RND transporter periplasmic adaptor subunit [Myxococcota bacterium]
MSSSDSVRTRALPGLVTASQAATLSFEVAGRIASLPFDVGDRFRRGDVLASLDRSSYVLQVQQRQADLQQTKAQRLEAEQNFERHQKLITESAVTQAAFDRAKAQVDSARSLEELADASLRLARDTLRDATLVAPYSGVVTQRPAEPQQQTSPGQPVLSIQSSDESIEVEIFVPETLVALLSTGSSHKVRFPSLPQLSAEATLIRLGARATRGAAFPVTLELRPPPPGLRPGMTANVDLRVEESGDKIQATSTTIPVTAFIPGGGQERFAFVFKKATSTVERRAIEIGTIENGMVSVSKGLSEGEIIATRGLSFLSDGEMVTLIGKGSKRYDPPVLVDAERDVRAQ